MYSYGDNDGYMRFRDHNPFSSTTRSASAATNDHLISSGYVSPGAWGPAGSTSREAKETISEEIRRLLQSAINGTERMSTMFDRISYLRRDAWREVSELCWSLKHCLRAPPEIRHSYHPPSESTWDLRRAMLIKSLKCNLLKYIQLSENLASKPLRMDKFRRQLEKLSAYHVKVSYLFGRIKASSEKMRLIQLRDICDNAHRQLRERIDEERKRRYEAQRAFYILKTSQYEALRNMQRRFHSNQNQT